MSTIFDITACLDCRTKDMGGAYKLSPGGAAQYGMDTVVGEVSYDLAKMSMILPFADGNVRDGVGDVLDVQGIDTYTRHRKNPIGLFDHGKGAHKFAAWPIARSRNEDGGYTVNIDPVTRTATAESFYYQGHEVLDSEFALYCEQLYDLGVKGWINGGSIGYQVIQASEIPPDYASGKPKGLHLMKVLMLEYSQVVLPANQETVRGKSYELVREVLLMPACCGKSLSPYLVKSLEAYVPEPRKAQLGYEGKKDLLPGGKGDDRPDSDFDPRDLKAGVRVEMEHTNDPAIAREIAKDHLTEDRDYYRKLTKVETGDKALKQPRDLSKTDYRPAKWKPGLGAIKKLRAKYKAGNESWGPSDAHRLASRVMPQRTIGQLAHRIYNSEQHAAPKAPMLKRPAKLGKPSAMRYGTQQAAKLGKAAEKQPRRDFSHEKETTSRTRKNRKVERRGGAARHYYRDTYSPNPKTAEERPKDNRKMLQVQTKGSLKDVDVLKIYQDFGKPKDWCVEWLSRGTPVKQEWFNSRIEANKRVDELTQKDPLIEVMDMGKALPDGEKAQPKDTARPKNEAGGYNVRGPQPADSRAERKTPLRRKQTPHGKGLRGKYQKAQGRFRTLKKSSPGSAVVHVHQKDMDEVKAMSEQGGLQCKWVGTHGGLVKMRLTGDDKAIEGVAQKFGRRVKGQPRQTMKETHRTDRRDVAKRGRRGISEKVREGMRPKQQKQKELLNRGIKSMDQKEMEPLQDAEGGEIEIGGDPKSEEKYSSQVLRHMHGQLHDQLQDYDAMRAPLEHEEIDKFVEKACQQIVDLIEEIEDLHSTHHGEEEPLPDTKGLDEEEGEEPGDDEDAEVADSDEGEWDEEEEEQEHEGLEHEEKRLGWLRYCQEKGIHPDDIPGDEEHHHGPGGPYSEKDPGRHTDVGEEESVHGPGRDYTEADVGGEEGADPGYEEFEDGMGHEADSVLEGHEKGYVKGAHGFLSELTQTRDFGDQHRMKAFMHGQHLEDLCGRLKEKLGEADVTAPGETGEKANPKDVNREKNPRGETPGRRKIDEGGPGSAMEQLGDVDPEAAAEAMGYGGEDYYKGWHKSISDAGRFLKSMAGCKSFGDPHRAEAQHHAAALDWIHEVNDADVEHADSYGEKAGGISKMTGHIPSTNKPRRSKWSGDSVERGAGTGASGIHTEHSQPKKPTMHTTRSTHRSRKQRKDLEEAAALQKAMEQQNAEIEALQKNISRIMTKFN